MYLANSTFEDVKKYLKNNKEIIIPFGAVEAHGRHLPIFTDVYAIEGIINEAKKRKLNTMVAPTISYTIARLLEVLPGTISLDFNPCKNYIKNIIEKFCETGFKTFYLTTYHGDITHKTAIKEAVHELQKNFKDAKFYGVDLWPLIIKEAKNKITEDDIEEWHAGEIETSLMMYLKPDAVRKDKLEPGKRLLKVGHFICPGKRNNNGVYGRPELASVNKGAKLTKIGSQILFDFIKNKKYDKYVEKN